MFSRNCLEQAIVDDSIEKYKIRTVMNTLYFSKNKLSRTLSPSNSMLRGQTETKQPSIDDRLDFLEDQLQRMTMDHNHATIHLGHIIEKTEDCLSDFQMKKQKNIATKIDGLEFRLLTMLQNEKEEMVGKRIQMKKFVEDNGRVIDSIVREEAEKERDIEKDLEEIVNKKIKQMRRLGEQVGPKSTQKNEGKTKLKKDSLSKLKETNLGNKVKKALIFLEDLLSQLKQPKSKMKKQCSKLLREYLRVLQLIEQGKIDRELKQEQLLIKIKELDSGDVTKQETISRIE